MDKPSSVAVVLKLLQTIRALRSIMFDPRTPMKRRAAGPIVLAFALLVASLHLVAQPGGTMRHVGYLSPGPGYPFEAFREGLQELAWISTDQG